MRACVISVVCQVTICCREGSRCIAARSWPKYASFMPQLRWLAVHNALRRKCVDLKTDLAMSFNFRVVSLPTNKYLSQDRLRQQSHIWLKVPLLTIRWRVYVRPIWLPRSHALMNPIPVVVVAKPLQFLTMDFQLSPPNTAIKIKIRYSIPLR